MRLTELPFAYTYLSRLGNYRAVAGYVAHEWFPLIITLWIAYSVPLWITAVMFFGFLSIYELGYLVNDLSESACEPGGNRIEDLRIKDLRINVLLFSFCHIFAFMLVAGLLFWFKGPGFAMRYSGLGVLVFGILLLHSSRLTRRIRFLRIFTFTVLAVYKFAPIVLPQVSWPDGQLLLMAVFLCYGFPRVIVYTVRKFGEPEAQATMQESFRGFQLAGLIAFAPILITVRLETRDAIAFTLIFALYFVICVSSFGLHLVRVKSLKQAAQAFLSPSNSSW